MRSWTFAFTLTAFLLSFSMAMVPPANQVYGKRDSKLIFEPTEPAYNQFFDGEVEMEVTVASQPIYFRQRSGSSKALQLDEVKAN